jgi:heavy metal sensor kinase
MSLSIRTRLTLWNTLGLGVVLLVFAGLVYGLSRRVLYHQIDHKLLTGFREIEQNPSSAAERNGYLAHWVYELHEHEGILAVVYGTEGKVRERTQELAEASIPPPPTGLSDGPLLQDKRLPGLGRQRVMEGRVMIGGQALPVVLLTPLEEVDSELARIGTVLLTAVPVALLFSGVLAYILARKALAPVDELRRRTREVTADRLNRRLPVANAGDELGRLAQTINDMIARLEHSFAEIRRFTADASHELRTPLTAIRTETEVALARPQSTEEYQRLLGSILEECDRLARLTDQLLTLAREDAGQTPVSREPIEISSLVRSVVEALRPLADAKDIRLQANGDQAVWVQGDQARLRQVMVAVLDNALKYTPERGAVDIGVQSQKGAALVTLRDSGIGIPPEHLPRVFERFYRVDKSRSREEGGTGLGLSIAQSILTAHGGRIELASSPGQGTVCTITIPRASDGTALEMPQHRDTRSP